MNGIKDVDPARSDRAEESFHENELKQIVKAIDDFNKFADKMMQLSIKRGTNEALVSKAIQELKKSLDSYKSLYNDKKINSIAFIGLCVLRIHQVNNNLPKSYYTPRANHFSQLLSLIKEALNRFLGRENDLNYRYLPGRDLRTNKIEAKKRLKREHTNQIAEEKFELKAQKLSNLLAVKQQKQLADNLIKTNPGNLDLVTAVVALDPSQYKFANTSLIRQILLIPQTNPADVVKHLNTETVSELINDGSVNPSLATSLFPLDFTVAKAAYNKDHSSIRFAVPRNIVNVIYDSLQNGTTTAEDAVKQFPNEPNIVQYAYQFDRNSIQHANPHVISKLVKNIRIDPGDAIKSFPNVQKILMAALAVDNNLITQMSVEMIVNIIKESNSYTVNAITAFPTNETIVGIAFIKAPNLFINVKPATREILAKTIMRLLVKGTIKADLNLIHYFGDHKEIILAAYERNPRLIRSVPDPVLSNLIIQGELQFKDVQHKFDDEHFIFHCYNQAPDKVLSAIIDGSFYNLNTFRKIGKIIISALNEKAPEKARQLIEAGAIRAKDAVKALPNDEKIIISAYKSEPSSIHTLPSERIVTLIKQNDITPHALLLQTFPDHQGIALAVITHSPELIKSVTPKMVMELINIGDLDYTNTLQNNADNSALINEALKQDPNKLLSHIIDDRLSSQELIKTVCKNTRAIQALYQHVPDKILEYINTGLLDAKTAIALYPNDERIVRATFLKAPNLIQQAAHEVIIKLLNQNMISPNEVVPYFPQNLEIISAAFKKDHSIIQLIDLRQIKFLLEQNLIDPNEIVLAHPQNAELILTCYKADPGSIKFAQPDLILSLVARATITPTDAIKAFPNNEQLISGISKILSTRNLSSPAAVVEAIINNILSPSQAVMHYPENAVIVEAAYKKDVLSIKHASTPLINQLGTEGRINATDVANAFGKRVPTAAEKASTETQLKQAMRNKDWTLVAQISNSYWFERPSIADKAAIREQLTTANQWADLYEFEQRVKNTDYQLTAGPLQKNVETYQLEELTRKMMRERNFAIETRNDGDYFVFQDGQSFNWTKIRTHANFQHVELNNDDYEAYSRYLLYSPIQSNLYPQSAKDYQARLYQNHPIPETPVTFQEMQAINIYTGNFYKQMNGLMRDNTQQLNYRTESKNTTRAALIHSVMCASGLRKAPLTDIPISYRGSGFGSQEDQKKRITAAAAKGVIELDGFVSSSIHASKAFNDKPVIFTFSHLRGIYIEPITMEKGEHEFLIPPTQVQITGYNQKNGKERFEARLVSELGQENKEGFTPIEINSAEYECLQYADPATISALVAKGAIAPEHSHPAANKQNNTLSLVDTLLFKIQLKFNTEHKPPEAAIKLFFSKISQLSIPERETHEIMCRIRDKTGLCKAFGIDPQSSNPEKISAIYELMRRATEGEVLYPQLPDSVATTSLK